MEFQNKNTNDILSNTYKKISTSQAIERIDIINNFSSEIISKSWEVLCNYIIKNYQQGKGTIIPKFGTFSFSNADVNLEGTTNQFTRDKKQRLPVFVVSNEFVEKLKTGIHTEKGLIYIQFKQNNSISHARVNYTEMAISMNLSKDKFTTLMNNLIGFIGDNIRKNNFQNKDLPGLGVLMVKNNVCGVKFNNGLINSVKDQPQKLIEVKKKLNLFMEPKEEDNQKNKIYSDFYHEKTKENLSKSLRSVRPKTAVITKISKDGENWMKGNLGIDLDEINNIEDEVPFQKETFLNDTKVMRKIHYNSLKDIRIPIQTLESIYFNKGSILSELKKRDFSNKGVINKDELIKIFGNIDGAFLNYINDIINVYDQYLSKNGDIEYQKFYVKFVSELKLLIHNETLIKTSNSMTSRPNSAKFPTINNIKSEGQNLKVELSEVIREIRTIKVVINKIVEKMKVKLEQIITISEFINILKDYDISYPHEKVLKILVYLEINYNKFSLKDFIVQLESNKSIMKNAK